jgi:hypothetical protein
MALCVRAIRSAERLLSGRSGSDPSYERFKIPADVCATSVPQALPCLVSPPESKYVRILASVLFQIGQYARIGQVDSLRVLPIPARYLNEPFQNALRFGFDRQFAPRVETAWTEIDRSDYGSLAVRDHNLAVQLQVP